MKSKSRKQETFEELEKLAHDTSDLKPLSPAMRRKWQAASRTRVKARPGRPRKDPRLKSQIVPVSMDPALLEELDRRADAAGVTRSRFIADS